MATKHGSVSRCRSAKHSHRRGVALSLVLEREAMDEAFGPGNVDIQVPSAVPALEPEPVPEDDLAERPEYIVTAKPCGICRRSGYCEECPGCARRARECVIPVRVHGEVDFDDYVEPELDGDGQPVLTFTDTGIL